MEDFYCDLLQYNYQRRKARLAILKGFNFTPDFIIKMEKKLLKEAERKVLKKDKITKH